LTLPAEFGPLVEMVSVTVCGDEAPPAIELKAHLTVVSGRPLQAKVTGFINGEPLAVFTVKVETVDSPAGAAAGVVGVVMVMFCRIVRATVVVAVRLPEVPVMVTVAVPGGTVPPTVRVKVLDVVVLVGLNEAVTPLGTPEAARFTLPLKPLAGFTVIVLVAPAPGAIVRPVGEADSVKLGAAVTVRLIVVVAVRLPDVPVMVTVTVPAVAVPLAVRVSTLVVLVLVGLKDAVTPLGKPE